MPKPKSETPETPVPTRHDRINEGTGAGVALDLVHPANEGFKEKITPKPIDEKVFIFSCVCGKSHFRHAGYIKTLLPYLKPGGAKSMVTENQSVMVCVACRKSYVWFDEQMYDVSDKIDLEAWEKAEKELHRATGPGGQC